MVRVYLRLEGYTLGKYDKKKPDEQLLTWRQKLLLDFHDVLYVLAGFMVIYMLFFRVVVVDGPSMNNTLVNGDRLLLISNVIYRTPEQGDIIVASKETFSNGNCVVKRVIATEGQVVNITGGVVYVDDVPLDEPYAEGITLARLDENAQKFPVTVPAGKVFVLGDNRGVSLDSRSLELGMIDEREILGRAVFLMLPGTDNGRQKADYGRIGAVG